MSHLWDHFRNDFTDGSTDFDFTLSTRDDPNSSFTTPCRVFFSDTAGARYIGFFISEENYSIFWATALLANARSAIGIADNSLEMYVGHTSEGQFETKVGDLPFAGRVHLYIDVNLTAEDKQALHQTGGQSGFTVSIRDRSYSSFMTEHETPLAFISHDSRDKDDVARPLAVAPQSQLCPVWFDEFALKPGDSLRESIDKGLSQTGKCILILSPNFLQNPGWTRGEFNAALNNHFGPEKKGLLPVWHNVGRDEVAAYSNLITDIYSLNTSVGIDVVSRRLVGVLRG